MNGASDQEIRELKEAGSASPVLRESRDMHINEGTTLSDRDLINDILIENQVLDFGYYFLREGSKGNTCLESDGSGELKGRYYWHQEMLRKMREFKG